MDVTQRSLNMRFSSDPRQLRAVRQRIQAWGERLQCNETLIAQLIIAVNEACMNIMQHAYKGNTSGEIVLKIEHCGEKLEVLLQDFADPIDPGHIKPRALEDIRPGGLGTHFIQQVMDEYSYGHLGDERGNFLRMVKRIV